MENIRKQRSRISVLAAGLLGELEKAVAVLEDISFPFRLSDYGLDPSRALVPFRYIRFLRNRYSSFDLIHEVGADDRVFELLDQRVGSIS